MSEADRERCLAELERHETEISILSLALAGSHAADDKRHADYLNAQVLRHRISVALLESRLGRPRHSGS